MSTNLPATFQERIKEKLYNDIAGLIPEGELESLVSTAIVQFKVKELPNIINAELTVFFKKQIQELMNTPEWKSRWDNDACSPAMSPMLEDMMVKAAPRMLANLMQYQFQNFINTLPQMRNY